MFPQCRRLHLRLNLLEVLVGYTNGQVKVEKLVMAVDSGVIVNPVTASGQIEGGMTQALGYALCEEMTYADKGEALQTNWNDYHIFRANEMPELETLFIETFEPSHPFGVKAVARYHGWGSTGSRKCNT